MEERKEKKESERRREGMSPLVCCTHIFLLRFFIAPRALSTSDSPPAQQASKRGRRRVQTEPTSGPERYERERDRQSAGQNDAGCVFLCLLSPLDGGSGRRRSSREVAVARAMVNGGWRKGEKVESVERAMEEKHTESRETQHKMHRGTRTENTHTHTHTHTHTYIHAYVHFS